MGEKWGQIPIKPPLIEKIRARFGHFRDGSRIRRVSRDEYLYRHSDGRSVLVYVFLILSENHGSNRSLDLKSLEHWGKESGGMAISEEDGRMITEKFRDYFSAFGKTMEAA